MAQSALPKCPTVEQPGSCGHATGRGPEAQQERQARGPVLLAAGEKVPGGDEVPVRCVLRLEVEEGSRSKEPQVSRSPQRDGRLTEVSGSGGTELARSGKVLPGLTGLAHERRRNHYFWNTILIWLPLGSVARQISRSNWVRMGLSLWDQLSAEAPCPAGQEHLCVGLRHSGDSTPSHYSSEGPVTPISSAKYFSKCPGTTTLDRGCPSSRSPM